MIVRVLARIPRSRDPGTTGEDPSDQRLRDFARAAVAGQATPPTSKAWINGDLGTQNWPICASPVIHTPDNQRTQNRSARPGPVSRKTATSHPAQRVRVREGLEPARP
jgi:hypothetical protein